MNIKDKLELLKSLGWEISRDTISFIKVYRIGKEFDSKSVTFNIKDKFVIKHTPIELTEWAKKFLENY